MDDGGNALANLLPFVFLIAVVYLVVVRPQRSRARKLAEVRAGLAVGARVITTAGIHATVRELEGDTVLLEVAPGVQVRFVNQAVVRLLEPAASSDPAGDDDPTP